MQIVGHDRMTPTDYSERNFLFVPLIEAIECPSGLVEHFKDCWWAVHPENGIAYWCPKYKRDRRVEVGAPQCNSNEVIARKVAALYPWAEVIFIPSVFRKIDVSLY